ncbi:MAG: acyl-CoA dehydrogenase family protein [Candidatus Jordarchaeaceae archaeon]
MPLEELYFPFLREEHVLLRKSIREFAKKEIISGAMERDKNADVKGTVEIFKKMAKLGYAESESLKSMEVKGWIFILR